MTLSVPDSDECAAAGFVTDGADCGNRVSGRHQQLTGDQYIDFLNATADHPAAICESTADSTADLTFMEEACTALKEQCTNNTKAIIENKRAILQRRWNDLHPVDPE